MPPWNTRLRPSRSPVRPPTTSSAPNTIEYAVMIHDSDAELAAGYDASMSGKATLTIERSSEAMKVPERGDDEHDARTGRRPTWGAASAVGCIMGWTLDD